MKNGEWRIQFANAPISKSLLSGSSRLVSHFTLTTSYFSSILKSKPPLTEREWE